MTERRQFLGMTGAALMGGFIPVPAGAETRRGATGYIRTNWSRDPFSQGSYSFIAKGARRRDHVALGQPIMGRLFFAGEATHPDYNSTVHAAYESGQIAAAAVAETRARSVAIVGAGVSGLTAAAWLAEEGFDVTVLEARERIGGRVWTNRTLGMPLDLGASWIHGPDGNPLSARADELGLDRHVTDATYVIRGRNGQKVSDAQVPPWLDDVLSVQHSLGASGSDINGRAYWLSSDYAGDDVILPGGYDELLGDVATDLDIRLGHVLTHVDIQAEGVSLRDDQGRTALFDAVVVTVPLGVLKQNSITFSPPLPQKKQDAIARLGFGLLDKVYLRYDEVFWDRDATWIITPENGLPPGQFNQWLNLSRYIDQPVIMALNGATPARDLASFSDAEIVQKAQQTLAQAYP